MKNLMAAFGAVAMLALPPALVTAPTSVSAEEAPAETGFEEVSGFSVLSRVSADRLSRQELNDTTGQGEFAIELTFNHGKQSLHFGPDMARDDGSTGGIVGRPVPSWTFSGDPTEPMGCRSATGECELVIGDGDDPAGVGPVGGFEDKPGKGEGRGGRTREFSKKALFKMCGSTEACVLFPFLVGQDIELMEETEPGVFIGTGVFVHVEGGPMPEIEGFCNPTC